MPWPTKFTAIRMLSLIYLLMLLASPCGYSEAAPAKAERGLKVGDAVPWIAGWAVDGQVINLNQLLKRGHKVNVLIVSASWCAACKVCLNKLQPMASRIRAKNTGLFAVDFMEDAVTAKDYLTKFGFPADSIILDRFGAILNSLSVHGGKKVESEEAALPHTVVFDQAGKVIEAGEGCPDAYLKNN